MAYHQSKKVKEQRKKKMNAATYFGMVAALVTVALVGVVIAVINFAANKTVVTVADRQAKKDLYTCVYFCNTVTSNNWQQYGFDAEKNPYEQAFDYYAAGDKFETWGDYFDSLTNDTIKYLLVMSDIAQKGGYEYTDEVQTHVKAEFAAIDADKGSAKAFHLYMLETFGAPVTKKTYKEYLTLYYRAAEFYQTITESKTLFEKYIGAQPEDYEKTYEEYSDKIDVVSFRYYSLENTAANAEKIAALKNAASEKEFQILCNRYENDKEYTEKDGSLYENCTLKSFTKLSDSDLAKRLISHSCKAGKVYFSTIEESGESKVEMIYVIKTRGKDTSFYQESEVQNWEYAAMGILLENYYDAHYTLTVSDKGLTAFHESIAAMQ